MNAQKQQPEHAEERRARAASALVRRRARARAVSHFGTSRCSDGSESAARRASRRARASGIEDLDELARRVLAGEPQEDLSSPVRARVGAARSSSIVPQARITPPWMIADAVAQRLRHLERVRRHHDRVAATRVLAEQILEDARRLGIEPDHRLVDDDHLGPMHERARDDQLLPHAVAVALHQLVAPLLEVEQREQLARAVLDLRPFLIVQAGDEAQELRARELLVDERPVGDEAELALRGDRIGGDVDAADRAPCRSSAAGCRRSCAASSSSRRRSGRGSRTARPRHFEVDAR